MGILLFPKSPRFANNQNNKYRLKSGMIGNHSWHMQTQILMVGDVRHCWATDFARTEKKKAEMIKGYSIIKQYVEKNETEF